MVLQNYQKLIEITSNLIYVFALGVGLKCPREINLNTLWGGLVMWWSQSAFHLVGKGLIGLEKSKWPPFLPDSNGPGRRQNDFPVTTFYTMHQENQHVENLENFECLTPQG